MCTATPTSPPPPMLTGAWQGEGDVLHILWSLCKCSVLSPSPGHRPPSSAAGTKHLLIGPLFPPILSSFAPVTDGGSLAASRAGSSLQVNTAPRLQSPRGAWTGLQSNVVTRQPRERAGDKSGGSRKRPVLVLEDRLLGPGFSERINLSRQTAGNFEHCTHNL